MTAFPIFIANGYQENRVIRYTPGTSTNAVIPGDLWFYDTATDTAKRCGADPALIGGISQVDSAVWSPFENDGQVPLYRLSEMTLVGMSANATMTVANQDRQYGIARTAGGIWQVDIADTSNKRIAIQRVDVANQIAYVQFLTTYLQFGVSAA